MPLRMSSMSLYSSSGTLNIVPRMDGLGTSFLLRFIFLESEIYFFILSAKRVRLRGWCSHGVRGNLVEIIILLRMSKTCLLHSGSGRQHRVGYWNSFLYPVCHILRFFWIVFVNILMELFIEIIFCMDYCRSSQFRREETKTSPSSHHSTPPRQKFKLSASWTTMPPAWVQSIQHTGV